MPATPGQQHAEQQALLDEWRRRGRTRFADEPCQEWPLVELHLEQLATPAQARIAKAHLQTCSDCRAFAAIETASPGPVPAREVQLPAGDEVPGADVLPFPTAASRQPLGGAGRTRWLRPALGWAVAASLLLLGGGLAWYLTRKSPPDSPRIQDVSMGGQATSSGDRILVHRRHLDSTVTPLDPGAHVPAQTPLGMNYSADEPGYLALFQVTSGATRVIYPEDGTLSASLPRGRNQQLDLLEWVPEGSDCLWYVGIFSRTPLSLAELTTTLQQQAVTGSGDPSSCAAAFQVAAARSVVTFPVQR